MKIKLLETPFVSSASHIEKPTIAEFVGANENDVLENTFISIKRL